MLTIKRNRDKNKYYLTSTGLWVRDFTGEANAIDINALVPVGDYSCFLENEMKNVRGNLAGIDSEMIYAPNVVIVSDGYKFEEKQHLLKLFPQDKVTIIGVNGALAKWGMHTRMDWYVVNNPYKECMSFLPSHSYYPRCIVSTRTNPSFIKRYAARLGVVYRYSPVTDGKFYSHYFPQPLYYLDDYRNPICAAIALAYRWEVRKLLLFCCDDVFKDQREGAIQIQNGLWMYPQHRIAHGLIEGNLYWLANQEDEKVKVADYSSGPEYNNVSYITEDELASFFG